MDGRFETPGGSVAQSVADCKKNNNEWAQLLLRIYGKMNPWGIQHPSFHLLVKHQGVHLGRDTLSLDFSDDICRSNLFWLLPNVGGLDLSLYFS